VEYSVGWAIDEPERGAITALPSSAWSPALDADGEVREGAQVAELSQLLQAYVAELDQPFPDGFDPGRSISASAHVLRPPAGVVLLATLDGQPVGCGAV
jgi:hypothetical protein